MSPKPTYQELKQKVRNLETELTRLQRMGERLKQYKQLIKVHKHLPELLGCEEVLGTSEARYRAVVEDQTELICRFMPNGMLTFVNGAYCRYFNTEGKELVGENFMSFIPEEDKHKVRTKLASLTAENPVSSYEQRVRVSSGEVRWLQWTNRAILDATGEIVEYQAVGRDITEEKRLNDTLKAALQEKDTLIQEIHHRVKNNLQVIRSLINMRYKRIKNSEAKKVCLDLNSKIMSMVIVHNQLYRNPGKETINLATHIQHLWDELAVLFSAQRITPYFDLDPVHLPLNKASPCGLLLNEILTNIFKHAFPHKEPGEAWISLKQDPEGLVTVIISDHGKEQPPENMDIQKAESLGLSLIRNLVQGQLCGRVSLFYDQGTTVKFSFQA